MQNQIEDQYYPIVTVMEMLNFQIDKEETYTKSRFINIFLKHYYRRRCGIRDIAKLMNLEQRTASELFRAETGMTFADFNLYYTAYRIHFLLIEYERQGAEMKQKLRLLKDDMEKSLLSNAMADNYVMKNLRSDMNRGINHVDSLSYSELAKLIGTLSRSGMARYVTSQRYDEITRELKIRKFVSLNK